MLVTFPGTISKVFVPSLIRDHLHQRVAFQELFFLSSLMISFVFGSLHSVAYFTSALVFSEFGSYFNVNDMLYVGSMTFVERF